MIKNILIGTALILSLAACGDTTETKTPVNIPHAKPLPAITTPAYDAEHVIGILKQLSSDDMQGRRVGTEGNAAARTLLKNEAHMLDAFTGFSEQSFSQEMRKTKKTVNGVNLIGQIDGRKPGTGPILIITAHYDHLGVRNKAIYNGADDNASGSAALFAIAQSFKNAPPEHDVRIVWLDGEEFGLLGARNYVKTSGSFNTRPVLNLNLDMIAQSQKNELYMSGSYHTPALKSYIEQAAQGTDINLLFGHDRPEDGNDDWTSQSDHAAFHNVGVPFVYFGVEDHPYYHKPTDTFETLPLDFYKKSLNTVVNAAHILDDHLDTLAKPVER